MNKLVLVIVAALSLNAAPAISAVIAVIDSGTDLNHDGLKNNVWTNVLDMDDAVDNDNNGLIDDVHGWNFAENNNKLYDATLTGTFSADVYKFFEIQKRILEGFATQSDRDWITVKRQDKDFIAELQTFGNFVHGTHVAGISAKDNFQAQIMPLKIMPTKAPKLPGMSTFAAADMSPFIKMGLKLLAGQQAKALETFSKYVDSKHANVANCSFGSSVESAKMILGPILKLALGRDPTDADLLEYGKYFMGEVVAAGKSFATSAPNTLFVIAAGNDNTNNDNLPVFPASLREPNTISVAATNGRASIASFSNHGMSVDVAAPGVGIYSAIPGNQYLFLSGTSQASPYVANVAAAMFDRNPNLKPSEIRQILMGTVDYKGFLQGIVGSSGIVNPDRATLAAQLSASMGVADAIQSSKWQVADVTLTFAETMNSHREEGFVLPMPGLFQ